MARELFHPRDTPRPEKRRTARAAAFAHPEPERTKIRIWPVFLPFSGCPQQCVYCSQPAATATSPKNPARALADLEQSLATALDGGREPLELGFFGGTFTAMPAPWPERFLALAAKYRDAGLVTAIRCSTRPDAVSTDSLARLKDQGLDMVELGIQTFLGPALAASRRGYDPATAHKACETVRAAGLALGVQLLPGLPGHTPEHLAPDVAAALEHRPAIARLYPCVVLKNTPLATLHASGDYIPWTLDETVPALAEALLAFWKQGVPVIRMGLAPEQDLAAHILDGPWHPALGQLARSEALFRHVRSLVLPGHTALTAPARYQSDVLGHKGGMRGRYGELGIKALRFEAGKEFRLE